MGKHYLTNCYCSSISWQAADSVSENTRLWPRHIQLWVLFLYFVPGCRVTHQSCVFVTATLTQLDVTKTIGHFPDILVQMVAGEPQCSFQTAWGSHNSRFPDTFLILSAWLPSEGKEWKTRLSISSLCGVIWNYESSSMQWKLQDLVYQNALIIQIHKSNGKSNKTRAPMTYFTKLNIQMTG